MGARLFDKAEDTMNAFREISVKNSLLIASRQTCIQIGNILPPCHLLQTGETPCV